MGCPLVAEGFERQEHRLATAAEDGCRLVEETARHADCLLLGVAAEPDQLLVLEVTVAEERERHNDLERRTRRQTGTDFEVRGEPSDDSAWHVPRTFQSMCHREDVPAPPRGGLHVR